MNVHLYPVCVHELQMTIANEQTTNRLLNNDRHEVSRRGFPFPLNGGERVPCQRVKESSRRQERALTNAR